VILKVQLDKDMNFQTAMRVLPLLRLRIFITGGKAIHVAVCFLMFDIIVLNTF
jgi:hypothetical protein